jgi:hypothetical protein
MPVDPSNKRYPIVYIDAIRYEDWMALAEIVIGMECQIENADDMEAVLRQVRWDARLRNPNAVQMRHLRLAVTLVQKGRIHQLRSSG